MNSQLPNLEEAANVAAEFIYSRHRLTELCVGGITNKETGLDNLPNEVSHLLQEIRHREARTQGVQSPTYAQRS